MNKSTTYLHHPGNALTTSIKWHANLKGKKDMTHLTRKQNFSATKCFPPKSNSPYFSCEQKNARSVHKIKLTAGSMKPLSCLQTDNHGKEHSYCYDVSNEYVQDCNMTHHSGTSGKHQKHASMFSTHVALLITHDTTQHQPKPFNWKTKSILEKRKHYSVDWPAKHTQYVRGIHQTTTLQK